MFASSKKSLTGLIAILALSACNELKNLNADAGTADSGTADASSNACTYVQCGIECCERGQACLDASSSTCGTTDADAGTTDAGSSPVDAGTSDAGLDAGDATDAGLVDAGSDAGSDAGWIDAGTIDAGVDAGSDAGVDAGTRDAGTDAGTIDAGTVDPSTLTDQSVTLTEDVKLRGYSLVGDNIVFIFDESTYGASSPSTVQIFGSFTLWSTSPLSMTKSSTNSGIWYKAATIASVAIPGNSGQPEFKFVTGGSTYLDARDAGSGRSFLTNVLLFVKGDDTTARLAEITANEETANTILQSSDYDLTLPAQQAQFANFRRVPGTTQLYRSYHPYKQSVKWYATSATEVARTAMVQSLMADAGIQSIVTLSSTTAGTADSTVSGETIGSYLYNIMYTEGLDLYLSTSYNQVYYQSSTAAFRTLIKSTVEFIDLSTTPPPVLVHCYLGTDRTGTVSAVLAALAGASWDEIVADYQISNSVGNYQFRDPLILAYSFQQMLGVDPATLSDQGLLQSAMTAYLTNDGSGPTSSDTSYLTTDEITALITKLTQ